MGGADAKHRGRGFPTTGKVRAKRSRRRERSERGNLCEFQNLVYIYLETVIDQKDEVISVDSTYVFYFLRSGDRIQQGTERRRLKHNIKPQN